MRSFVQRQAKYIRLAASVISGALAFAFLKADFFDKASQELIAVFGLMMAAVLPTMVLTATVLRSGGLSVKRIEEYRIALTRQLQIWAGLFLLSLCACTALVIGKTISWHAEIRILTRIGEFNWNFATLLNGIIVALLVLLTLRAKAVIDGIRSLIDLSADVAVSEAKQRDETLNKAVDAAISRNELRQGYGDYVSLKTGRRTTRRA